MEAHEFRHAAHSLFFPEGCVVCGKLGKKEGDWVQLLTAYLSSLCEFLPA